ncbi:MAG: serine hydrolase [Bacteroidota bacterium]
MKKAFLSLLFLAITFAPFSYLKAQNQTEVFDQMLSAQYPKDGPGATALVAVGGEIVYHKGFGMANMEHDVPMENDMVFEFGSITKQFTAVSILMLMEQGKLSLQDDITKYLEDYPTHGHSITIHHLLTHTSGIKSYTGMEKWVGRWREDFEPLGLIDFFKDEPIDFAPGEEYRYNNSGYFILGYIIEKVSGQTYEDFVENNIFKPLGMDHSYYGHKGEIIKKRANGYQSQEKLINAEFLSMTQPYAAGSLMSTVGDLYKWNRGVRAYKLISKESTDLAFSNYTLNNGKKINYGYGWGINEINGSQTIEHGGGIFGYVTNGIYLPEEDVFVAVFSNCDCNPPGNVSTKMAALALGKPFPNESKSIAMETKSLEALVGVYDFEDESTRIITLEDNQLFSQRTGGGKFKIFPISESIFVFEDSFASFRFEEEDGKIKAFFENRIEKTEGYKTDKAIPTREEITLSETVLQRYTGTFNLFPNFDIVFTLEDGKFISQATGQGKMEIFAETETKFFSKQIDAQIEFMASKSGKFDTFILYQAGQEMKGTRKD